MRSEDFETRAEQLTACAVRETAAKHVDRAELRRQLTRLRSVWPELRPGAGLPVISAERNRLKWLITCGAVVSRSRTTVSSGTISPFAARA